uniref:G patch domain-containing protein 1-like protein n=1 Tax=Bactrocera dorsalis TaxID=27457 RepID=A0A034VT31_BACDO
MATRRPFKGPAEHLAMRPVCTNLWKGMVNRKERKSARSRNQREMYVMQQYGYQPNASSTKSPEHSDDAGGETESSDEETDKITFAPDDYEPYVCLAKKIALVWATVVA